MFLAGRTDLLHQITEAVEQARNGHSQVLVLEGEAGHGKSALLETVHSQLPADATVLTASGHPAETDIGHAGLHQLLRPVLADLDALDEPHRSDLRRALSLGYGPAPTRLAVGHALLMLLARVAANGPVVALIDDVHWWDRSSLQALVFAARRLDADPVCLVLASRPGEDLLTGLGSVLAVPPLDPRRAAELLRAQHPQMSARVADLIAQQSGGLPLALVEIPRELTDAELTGEAPVPDLLPVAPSVERVYAKRLSSLSIVDRHALLLASLDDHSPQVLERLLAQHDLGLTNLAEAERLGLVSVHDDGTCAFDHPTIRSAIQAGHAATKLADAHGQVAALVADDPVRFAFHLQRVRPVDADRVESALAAAAEHLDASGSGIEAGRTWEAAGDLSSDISRARDHWANAVTSLIRTSDVRSLRRVVERLIDTATNDVDAARWKSVHTASLLWSEGRQPDDVEDLIDLGGTLIARTDDSAITAGLDLLHAAMFSLLSSGHAGRAHQIALSLRRPELASRLSVPQQLLGDAVDVMVGAPGAGRILRGSWLTDLDRTELADPSVPVGYFGSVLVWLADIDRGRTVVDHLRSVEHGGDAALVSVFAATVTEALLHSETGEWDRAALEFGAAEALAADADYYGALNLLALWHSVIPASRGDAAACEQHRTKIPAADTVSHRHLDGWVRGLLQLSLGDHTRADEIFSDVHALEQRAGLALSGYTSWFADWVEARWHLGTADSLTPQVEELGALAERMNHPTMAARAARCRALLVDDSDAAFTHALDLHNASSNPYERARTELLWGRVLRRSRRRGEARHHLERALATFESLRADAWAVRTRSELAACGVRTADEPGVPTSLAGLTPREFHVAREVATGATNVEAANRLFVSPRTVEYHLSNVYRKLGIAERHDLVDLFGESR